MVQDVGAITYLAGDATEPQGSGLKIIAHICNDVGAWGNGFVLAVSRRWPEPKKRYLDWYQQRETSGFRLGAVQFVQVEPDILVANMIGQRGIRRTAAAKPPIRYDALEGCLEQVAEKALALSASIHMPRIGCGLAGGSWDMVEPIIVRQVCAQDVPVLVYDSARFST
jgi:O-acetyl-ADP-ribose deacetylase (regulator of RNase III)